MGSSSAEEAAATLIFHAIVLKRWSDVFSFFRNLLLIYILFTLTGIVLDGD